MDLHLSISTVLDPTYHPSSNLGGFRKNEDWIHPPPWPWARSAFLLATGSISMLSLAGTWAYAMPLHSSCPREPPNYTYTGYIPNVYIYIYWSLGIILQDKHKERSKGRWNQCIERNVSFFFFRFFFRKSYLLTCRCNRIKYLGEILVGGGQIRRNRGYWSIAETLGQLRYQGDLVYTSTYRGELPISTDKDPG